MTAPSCRRRRRTTGTARNAVRALARHLEERRAHRHGWRSVLLRELPWTEHAIYQTFVQQTRLLERYDVVAGEDPLYDNCVWIEEQFDEWDPAAGAAPFTVVQSARGSPRSSCSRGSTPCCNARASRSTLRALAIAVAPDPGSEKRDRIGSAVVWALLVIVVGLFVCSMLDAYVF